MSFRLGVMLLLGSLTGCWQRTDSPPLNDDPEKCMREARGYMDTNRPGEAIKCLEGFIQRTGNKNGEISELLASACLLDQDMELAALYFEQAASLSELKYYCYLKAAEIYEKLGDYSQAIPCYKWYLQILPEDSEIQVKYAQALLLDGEKKKALAILVAHCIDDAKVHNQIAELFFEMENYIQGRNWYFSAFGCEKNNLEALRGLWK
ncbi:MAG: tetratricopeptide repeat protein, partial [Puniceicoccales bacterium]|nr:tetratricopeptide repeat protein [Puniceicoccales bacterium]